MTVPPVISLRDISLSYGSTHAVRDVSIDFREGEFFALLGPSGCGKTSLLRMMAGFADPTSGQMTLDGADLAAMPARKRPVNMMFQSYALFPHMTVEGNIRYGLETAGLPRAEIEARVADILARTDLTALARRKPHQLSGGQRQRVALARALVMRPRVVLLDEPLAALDRKLRESMQLELKRLQHQMGLTFIVVTHDQEEALVMADRIGLMNGGRMEQIGTAEDLYERPATRFVASFVGKTNFFSGQASGDRVMVPGLGPLIGNVSATGEVSYSIRPERITVTLTRSATHQNGFEGLIEEIAYHGTDENLMVRLPGQAELTVARLAAGDPLAPEARIGKSVWLNWNGSDSRVLTQ